MKKKKKIKKPDVCVQGYGSVIFFNLKTEKAWRWVKKNVHIQPYAKRNDGFLSEHRFAADIAHGMRNAGLRVA
jgi:hypothetical protein